MKHLYKHVKSATMDNGMQFLEKMEISFLDI